MIQLIPSTWRVPETLRNHVGEQPGRQRAIASDGHLLLILHAPPKGGDPTRTGRFFWRDPDGQWMSNGLGTGGAALTSHLNEYAKILMDLDRKSDVATTSHEFFAVLETLTPMVRTTRNMHAALQEARTATPDVRELINFCDRAYELERTAELLMQETKNALDVAVARRAEEESRASQRMAVATHRLNLLAAFFLPLGTLMTIFGANLQNGWEHVAPPLPMLAVIGAGLFCGTLLTLLIVHRHGE